MPDAREGDSVKMASIVFASMQIVMPAALAGQTLTRPNSGFPNDFGRPNDGLPLPDGPRGSPPQRAAYARGPSMKLALAAAEAAEAACRAYRVGVAVIDSAGMPKLYHIPDGTTGYHAYTAFRKAWTALSFARPTSEVGALTRTDPAVRQRIVADSNYLSFAGGLPLIVDGSPIGAIGVSGADISAVDERCAQAGVDAIRRRLR